MLTAPAIMLASSVVGTTTASGPGKPSPIVGIILRSDLTPEARMKALEPFLNIGMTQLDADRVLGESGQFFGSGPGFLSWTYRVGGGVKVEIGCYPGGEIY